MNYEAIRGFFSSQEGMYTVIGAASVASFFLGYGIKALRSRGNEARIAEAEARKAEYDFKAKRLDCGEEEHRRQLEIIREKREYELEDKDRQRAEEKEDEIEKQRRREERHKKRSELVGRLVELRPVLEQYLSGKDEDDLYQKRDEYRRKIAQGILDHIDESEKGGVARRLVDGDTVIDDDVEVAIAAIVDQVYPLSSRKEKENKLPPELSNLFKIITEEVSQRD